MTISPVRKSASKETEGAKTKKPPAKKSAATKTAKTKNLEKEIKDQEGLIKVRVDENKLKLKELEEKYDNMYKKIINLEVNLEDKKYRLFDTDLFTIDELILFS